MSRTAAAALLALLFAIVGCGTNSDPPPSPPIPEPLVGTWTTITPRGSAFSYEISADGLYVFIGIMQDQTLQHTLQESGAIEVRGNEITLRPNSVTITRSDSSVPADNYRSSVARPPRTVTWTINGDELTLVEDGQSTTYRRE